MLLQEEGQDYGVDWGGPVPHDSKDHDINIPEIPNPLTRVDMLELQATLLHEESNMQYGVDSYERVLFLENLAVHCKLFMHIAFLCLYMESKSYM